jgi:hypothetical protein
LLVGVENRAEVEREGVLTVINMRSVVHEGLLESNIATKSVIITNRPSCKSQ